jgi:hypothetical protein
MASEVCKAQIRRNMAELIRAAITAKQTNIANAKKYLDKGEMTQENFQKICMAEENVTRNYIAELRSAAAT